MSENARQGADVAADLAEELRGVLGPDRVDVTEDSRRRHSGDGLTPAAVVRPASLAELRELVSWAHARRIALSPWGGGTKQNVGRPLGRLDVVVRTEALSAVHELDEGNLTAEVGGGLALGDLQARLSQAGLFFALDPLEGERATVGGTIATNSSGPRRLLYRTARDHVLGLSVVLPTGELLRAGSKTVKDVAGYNLTKLFIGSWGTLGIIVGATLRLLPLPEESATVVVRLANVEAAVRLALAVRGSVLTPAALEICSDDACRAVGLSPQQANGPAEAWLLCGLEGHREQVDRMRRQLQEMARAAGALAVTAEDAGEGLHVWQKRRLISPALLRTNPDAVRAKVSVPMASLGGLLAGAEELARRLALALAYAAHAGNGVAQVYLLPREGMAPEAVRQALARLAESAAAMGGFLTVEVAPLALRRDRDLLPPRDDYTLMHAIRMSINREDGLNPGKVV